ncbi:hypothetical protein BCR24_11335 [Enterococcus ureilyticus]|uniref:DUF92 domain-containing protein n=1 Tax=Enterococcus ureilyticus TaxID=1131292 RepID=A0A1E5HF96_9ENTE|nr:DUF92 domain-containing protein [Enterococcus ureilyticus]MBM7689351.1 uncharacterized protein (TIGR00297 family) [Enterococcus ureilyticus]OEG23618.1 hypothetical protein BCR24_11335 [Enterococcus ureilyticus]
MTILLYKLLIGMIVGSFIGIFSYITHLLTKSGTLAMIFVAIIVCGFGSWPVWELLILFFASSGFIHLIKKGMKRGSDSSVTEKGHTRDACQVLANSLPAIISLILFYYTDIELFLIGYVSGIAGATSDTWASEIGILSKEAPYSILSFKPITPGLSGGISLLGTISSLLGSLLIATAFWLNSGSYEDFQLSPLLLFSLPLFCGFLDSLIDSLLGIIFQVKYRCPICGSITEQQQHHHQSTLKISGISWVTNDWVNFFSGSLTVLFSWLLTFFME